MKLQDAYSLLGIEPGCDGDDIRKAFRKQALIWHPDKNSNSDECTEMFQRIQTAYAKLTRELSGEYSCGEDSEDDDYYDEYDDEDDEDDDDCDYDCDCFFHGGIPPWEFFEQLFAAMESGQYNGYPPGFPFHEGGFPFPRSSGGGSRGSAAQGQQQGQGQQHDHQCPHHSHHHDAEADAYYDHTYAYESREERRLREREEQKLEKMWRKEMEMAERENIRAANAAKAAKSLAQQRNVTAWMRQMPRPTMASRDDTSIELVLVRKGVATDELPNTCVGKLETRKNGESSWAKRIVDKDTSKVKVDILEPGTSYYFRVCSGQHHPDGNEEWGEWSVESRYATTGKAPTVAAQHDSAPDRGRKAKHSVAPRASKASVGNGGGNQGHSDAHDSNGAAEAEEDRLRKEEKERAIQKALEAAAADYEETQKSFMPADSGASVGTNKKKKKKKNKGKAAADPTNDIVAAAAAPQGPGGNSASPQPRQAPYQPPLKVVEDVRNLTPEELEAAENEELARALEESLSMYKDTVAAKEAVAHALGPQGGPPEQHQQQPWVTVPKPQAAPRGAPGPHLWAQQQQQQQQPSRGTAVKPPGAAASVIQQLPKPVPSSMVQPQAAVGRKQPPPPPPPQQQQQQQQHVRSPTICKFFNSEQGCKWGLNCKFQHLDQGGSGGPKGPFKVGSANGNGIRQQQDGATGLQQAPVCSHFASGQGCRYGSQCKFLHELPQQQQQQQQQQAMAPDASSLPSTLFPDTPGPFAPPPPPPKLMQPGAPATTLPVPQPIGAQQQQHQQQSNPFGFSGGPELPVPMPVPSKQQQQQQLGGLRAGLPQPFPVSHGFHSLGGHSSSMQQQQLKIPQPPLDDHRPLATLFPATSSLSDPTDASAAASALFPDHTGPGAGAGSFLGLAAASGAAPGAGVSGWGTATSGGFPGFVDFGMSQLGAVGKHALGSDLGEPQELPQEEHIAALDAEAFLNSISMGPEDAQQHMLPPEAVPGPLPGSYRGASAAPARPRYNPVGSYNPLVSRGPP